ncbi:hypothetical protein ACJIZ3_007768 [Penstemon smallii]|uniref:FLZ-type domain-containing protein n=1 Tax=Penstemon smallii TaxID=265156 RepID=A0ABD3T9K7_9LAMI
MRSASFQYPRCEDERYQPHFLDSCFLCHKQISQNSDIYMYRGNTPFCSQECRQEQIEMDESNEKRLKLSSKRSNQLRQSKESDTNKAVRTGTVVVG